MPNSITVNKKRYMILALLFLGWCLSYLDRMAMNVGIVEIAKDFKLSPTVMGVVLSSFCWLCFNAGAWRLACR